jgi:(S)-mandelate dehydrogenase
MQRRLYVGTDVTRASSIEELRAMARRRVPNFAFEYVEGGAEDEETLRRNREAFANVALLPRTLVDVKERSQAVTLFGRPSASPFLIGPTGFNGMLSDQADLALARAAREAGVPFVLSHVSTTPLERVAAEAGGRIWMQLYPFKDREVVRRLIERAAAAGCEALVVTTDCPLFGNREWDRRNYRAPMKLDARNLLDVLLHPRWIADVLVPNGVPRFGNLDDVLPPGQNTARNAAAFLSRQMDPSLNWRDLDWLRSLWPGKLVVKGILVPDDARRAESCGADGIILSNHGGRQLDGAVSAFEVLPEVAAALGPQVTLLVNGGFRRGADVVKAVALGAHAVLLGRATLYGVAAGGQAGAARALAILRAGVDRVIGLLGCPDIAALDAGYLLPAAHGAGKRLPLPAASLV